ncbi:uncharacterized protein MYCFIDRAFT_216117 [Pseudocercospora fijiensis CIRAD86]|uniref:Uncharacterized protein n=1 Tax=Pseudocercospora fijiensis (strain CIRAD86) TaxID=383855 RepID=M2YR05_PSEFD|nr:uncharacterized protein MYCFIDRAFT_216117 [Pseudocercospora fijiensis CIRAD86]EME80145.1 hypothetical protein MYCFIDRAFT_216117 [Pseudocercospora fijiensis CIRAD86]
MLFSNMKHGALSHAYLTRKGTFLGRREWRAVAKRVPFSEKDESSRFYDLALQVPALLERHDQLDEKGDSVTVGELDQLLLDVRNIEAGLRTWWRDFNSSLGNFQPYWLVSIDEFDAFKNLVKDEARTVDKAWMFPNFMFAYLISCYWDTMHLLRTCVKNLHLRRYESSAKSHDDEASWSMGASEVAWEVRDSVFVKGMRPPSAKERQPRGSQKLFVVTRRPGSALVGASG